MSFLEYLGIIPKNAPARLRHNLFINFWEGIPYEASFVLVNFNTVLPSLAVLLIARLPALKGWENRAGVMFIVMVHAGWCLLPLFSSFWAHGLKTRLPLAIKLGLWLRYPWFLAGLGLLVFLPGHPAWALASLYLSILAYAVGTGLNAPLWQELVALTVPARLRGKLFGWRGLISGFLGLALLNALRPLQRSLPFPYDYGLAIFVVALGTSVSMALFMRLKEPPRGRAAPTLPLKQFLSDLLAELSEDRKLKILLRYRFVQSLIYLGSSALVTVRALKVLALPDGEIASTTNLLTLASFLGIGAAQPLWGRLADRKGWKNVELAAMTLLIAGCLIGARASGLGTFCLGLAILGAGEVGLGLSGMSFVLEFGPSRRRASTIALHNLAWAPSAFLPLAGGALADRFGAPPVLVGASLAALFLLAWARFRLKDPRGAASRSSG